MIEANSHKEAKEPLIQTWAIWIALVVFILALGIYAIQFIWGLPHLSPNPEAWGQLGDFLGGMVNPIIGLITIWLLATSLKQNQIALKQSKQALERAEEEVRLTREALEQSKSIQEATESALREQIKIAAHARDMNNAISLWSALEEQAASLNLKSENALRGYAALVEQSLFQKKEIIAEQLSKLDGIMSSEIERLASRYQTIKPTSAS